MTAAATDPVGLAESIVGLPVATVVVAVVLVLGFALHRRIIVLGRELVQQEEAHANAVQALEESHQRELDVLHKSATTMIEERNWWRNVAVKALDLGEQAVASGKGTA